MKTTLPQKAPHEGAKTHVTGQSLFVDDVLPLKDEMIVTYVGSPVARGRLLRVRAEEALKVPGVIGVMTARDVHHNLWGTIVKDQPLIVSDKIGYRDEPLCILAAENKKALDLARKLIKFDIEGEKPVLTIEEAIERKDFLYSPQAFRCGSVDEAFRKAPHVIKGHLDVGGQEHFYLESQAAIAYPIEGGQIKILSSTQHPTETQHLVAEALGVPLHQVVCEVRRMGGAFGGKESQAAPFAAMAALFARKYQRSARIAISKDDDMKVTGKRHPFKNFYEVAFDRDGRILGLKFKLYADGGAYTDLSPSICDRAMFHADGSYFIENGLIEAWVCKTNTHSNTAFRGFGGPQGNVTIENAIEEIAQFLKKDSAEVRHINLYQKTSRNLTPYGQTVENNLLPELFDEIMKTSDYKRRRREIDAFNAQGGSKIRGLALTAVKFGISFTAKFLNQGNALVNIHRDGTVQVSTGATEMGQGVNTKIGQVVAHSFGIPFENVQVMTTSTEKNANTSPTAASSGSDINGSAALNACEKILFRLKHVALHHFQKKILAPSDEIELSPDHNPLFDEIEFRDSHAFFRGEKMGFKDLIHRTYENRIALSDFGYYKTLGLSFDKGTRKGNAFQYFTAGMAVSEVLIDTYTAETKVMRCDVLMDLGRPMNAGVDMGQLVGGFSQGVGWVTTEKLYYDAGGGLVSHSPTTYKIPNIQDIPRELHANFYENNLNCKNLHGSKAVGEPPLLLGASVLMAVKNAVHARSRGEIAKIRLPATPEVILLELHRHEL